MEIFFTTLASAFAGFVDAIVGGGGLILLPALFSAYPWSAPATLLGTNKSASIWGTAFATWQYSQRVHIRWTDWAPACASTMLAAFAGAWLATWVSPHLLRQLLPFVLLLVLAYTLWRKDMGQQHAPRLSERAERWATCIIGGTIGLYDGFFGPGTGSFFVFVMVRWLGYDFLNASVAAKLLNLASNLAALTLFTLKGHVWWHMTVPLALANVAGSLLGTRMALQHGARFVRLMFIVVVSALILKTGHDAFGR